MNLSTETLVDSRDLQTHMSFLELITAIGEQKRLFLWFVLSGTIAAAMVVTLLPREYTAGTLLMPPQQQGGAAGALAQLGALAGVATSSIGVKAPDEMYIALLKSRRVQEALVKRFDLRKRYDTTTLDDTRKALSSNVSINSDKKSGLITVAVDDQDAKVAADLANAHVEELSRLLEILAVTEAQQRRQFFEQQVTHARRTLVDAELKFRIEQAKHGLVVSQLLAETALRASVELRSQIAMREVQLQAMRRFATERNPEALRVASELGALRQQLNIIEQGDGKQQAVSEGASLAVNAYREMKVREAALEALIRQFEVAKVDEAREGPSLQVVDKAILPELPSKPKRAVVVIIAFLASAMLATVVALVRALSLRGGQESAKRWTALRHAWLGR